MNKKVLAIYGSPRKDGNTSALLDSFLKGLEQNKFKAIDAQRIYTKDLEISSCAECRSCSRDGVCILKDKMQDIYDKLVHCDFLAVSSPIFFTTVSGNLKPLIDRCQRFWALKYELKRDIIKKRRKGIFISTAGYKSDEIFSCAKKVIRALFDVLYIDYDRDFLHSSIDHKGDIQKKEDALGEVFEYGRALDI
jgi:multimeric flavodoxin WrbA